jgi:hypothetical protein
MSVEKEQLSISNEVVLVQHDVKRTESIRRADNVLLAKLGYKSEFKREFSVSVPYDLRSQSLDTDAGQLIETVAFSFSIMGVVASVSSTFIFPLSAGNGSLVKRHGAVYNQLLSFTRRPCWDGMGLAHPLPICSVRRGISR